MSLQALLWLVGPSGGKDTAQLLRPLGKPAEEWEKHVYMFKVNLVQILIFTRQSSENQSIHKLSD